MLLTTQSDKGAQRLLDAVPEIHLVLGGDRKKFDKEVIQISGSRLAVKPEDRGRGISKIDLDLQWPIVKFYSPATSKHIGEFRNTWQELLTDTKKDMAKSDLTTERKEQLQEREVLQTFARATLFLSLERSEVGRPTNVSVL